MLLAKEHTTRSVSAVAICFQAGITRTAVRCDIAKKTVIKIALRIREQRVL